MTQLTVQYNLLTFIILIYRDRDSATARDDELLTKIIRIIYYYYSRLIIIILILLLSAFWFGNRQCNTSTVERSRRAEGQVSDLDLSDNNIYELCMGCCEYDNALDSFATRKYFLARERSGGGLLIFRTLHVSHDIESSTSNVESPVAAWLRAALPCTCHEI